MPLPLLLIPLAIQAAAGIGKTISGAIGGGKARRAQRELEKNRPKYATPQGELDMLSLLQNRASQGLSDNSLNQYSKQSERGLTSSLDAIIKGGGSVNNVGNVYQGYLDNIGNLTLANDQAQLANMNNFLTQQRRVSDYQDKEWEINKYAPHADKAQALAQDKAQADAQKSAGINTALSAAASTFGPAGLGGMQNVASAAGGTLGGMLGGMAGNAIGSGLNRLFSGGNRQSSGTGFGPGLANNYFNNTNPGGGGMSLDSFKTPSLGGYDWSTLKPSDRTSLMQLMGNQFQY